MSQTILHCVEVRLLTVIIFLITERRSIQSTIKTLTSFLNVQFHWTFTTGNTMIELSGSINRVLVFHLRVLGLWFPEKFSLLYIIYAVLLYIIFSLIYVSCMCANFFFITSETSVSDMTESMLMTLEYVALLFKSVNFFWYNRDMQNNLKIVNTFQLQNDDEVNFVKNRMRVFRNLWFVYYSIINVSASAGYQSTLFRQPRTLPFKAWYPFDWQHNEQSYWIIYAFQVLGMVVQSNMNIIIEIFPSYLMYVDNLKMEILGMRLRGIAKNLKGNSIKDIDIKQEEQQKSIDDLVNCIKLHQHIEK